jgi:hypothetical protein
MFDGSGPGPSRAVDRADDERDLDGEHGGVDADGLARRRYVSRKEIGWAPSQSVR